VILSSCEFEDPSLTNISDQSNLTFLKLKRKNPRFKTNIESEHNTSSKILTYDYKVRSIDLTFEPNTAMVRLSESIYAIAERVEPARFWMGFFEPTLSRFAEIAEPFIPIAKCIEPINKIANILKPIKEKMTSLDLINKLDDNFEPISSTKLESEKDNIEEPDDFFILSNNNDGLILSSEEEIDALLDELKNVKYDEELARLFSNYKNDIEDLTE